MLSKGVDRISHFKAIKFIHQMRDKRYNRRTLQFLCEQIKKNARINTQVER